MIINPRYTVPVPAFESEKTRIGGFCAAISGRRYYSPALGRFINRDPIEEQGGLNLYAFCVNNPINKWDLLGNSWASVYDEGIGVMYRNVEDDYAPPSGPQGASDLYFGSLNSLGSLFAGFDARDASQRAQSVAEATQYVQGMQANQPTLEFSTEFHSQAEIDTAIYLNPAAPADFHANLEAIIGPIGNAPHTEVAADSTPTLPPLSPESIASSAMSQAIAANTPSLGDATLNGFAPYSDALGLLQGWCEIVEYLSTPGGTPFEIAEGIGALGVAGFRSLDSVGDLVGSADSVGRRSLSAIGDEGALSWRKPGSLGQFKGTDALRAENNMARDAAKAVGLSKDQAQRLHLEISGRGLGYKDIVQEAKQIKGAP